MFSSLLCNIIVQILVSAIRQENKIEVTYIGNKNKTVIIYIHQTCPHTKYDKTNKKVLEIQIGKEEIFAGSMIVYIVNFKEST